MTTVIMSYRKTNIDYDKINQCRALASRIIKPIHKYIERHSTLSIESATLSILGFPSADLIITRLGKDLLRQGVCTWIGKALVHTNLTPKELGLKLAHGQISAKDIPDLPIEQAKNAVMNLASKITLPTIATENFKRSDALLMIPSDQDDKSNALADLIQVKSTKHLKQSIAKINKTPENSKRFLHKISGLGVPQKALQTLDAGVHIVAHDFFEEIFSHNLNVKRSLIDSFWLYQFCTCTKSVLYNEGSSVRNLDTYREAHQVLVNHFLVEELAKIAGIVPEQFSIGHGFDLPLDLENGFLLELARACLIREIFPRNLTVYLAKPKSEIKEFSAFLFSGLISEQSAFMLPELKNSFELLEFSRHFIKNTQTLGEEIQFDQHAKISRRAHIILENTIKALRKIEHAGFYQSLGQGLFLGLNLSENQGTGLDGIFQKDRHYFNPIWDIFKGLTAPSKPMIDKDKQKTRKQAIYKKKRFKRKKKCQASESL
ncbi:MAG: lysine 5,6-aminomutase subunit alpha [Pseudomonadota bacterium]